MKSEVRYFLAESLWNSGKDRKRAIEIMKVARKLSEDGGEGAKGGSRSGSQPTTREHALRPHSVQSTSDW